MGSVISYWIFKCGKEPVKSEVSSLWDISAVDIDGKNIEKLGSIAGAKCTLIVNVACK